MRHHDSEILERRQEELQERLDPSWQPDTTEPVLAPGNIRYEMAARTKAINFGGLGLIVQLVRNLGLAEVINEGLHLFKRHRPYHESDHILNLVYNIISGGQNIEDLEPRRQNVAYLDALNAKRIPDPTTEGDFIRRFGREDDENLMDLINDVRRDVWLGQPSSMRRIALIDADGTIVETGGECKEGAHFSYKGKWGFGPLVISLANTQEVLYTVNRPANRPSHDGAAEYMDKAVAWARGANFEKVRLRGDTDFSLTTNFDRWTEDDVEFVFGIDAHSSFKQLADSLQESCWKRLFRRPKWEVATEPRQRPKNVKEEVVKAMGYTNYRLKEEHVAEFDYTPTKAKGKYRMIALRKTILVEEGQELLFNKTLYYFYVTNVSASVLSTGEVVRQCNARCNQENLIEQLKNGVHATRMPSNDFNANWAYMIICSLAWNLKIWLGLKLPERLGAKAIIRMEFRRFCNEIIQIPTQILRSGNQLIFRTLQFSSWLKTIFDGHELLKRQPVR